jgi:hypothetical protein
LWPVQFKTIAPAFFTGPVKAWGAILPENEDRILTGQANIFPEPTFFQRLVESHEIMKAKECCSIYQKVKFLDSIVYNKILTNFL